jgi:hypothetical protein
MTDFSRPENHSPTGPWSQPQAQPSPQDGAIPPAAEIPQYQQYQAGMAPRAMARPSFDFGRLHRGDLIAGISSFIVFITLFLSWYSFGAAAASASQSATPAQQQLVLAICADQPAVCSSQTPPQFSVGGLSGVGGGWHYLILVVAIVAVLYVLSRATDAMPQATRYHWQTLLGLTALQGLLVLIAFASNPLSLLDSVGSSGWGVGAILALIAAIAAVAGAILVMQEGQARSA